MADYYAIVTDVGNRKIAEALERGTTLKVDKFVVGDGGGNRVIPNREQTKLVRQVWEGAIESFARKGNELIATAEIPADTGGFTVREMGLIDESGNLIAVANVPETVKTAGSNILNTLSLTISIKVENTECITFVIYDGVTDYGVCTSAADETEKVVEVKNFVLAVGSKVYVKFVEGSSAEKPTLNVNGTGAAAVCIGGSGIGAGVIQPNRVYGFAFDGTNFELMGGQEYGIVYDSGERAVRLNFNGGGMGGTTSAGIHYASAETAGIIKIGNNLDINDEGVVSVKVATAEELEEILE